MRIVVRSLGMQFWGTGSLHNRQPPTKKSGNQEKAHELQSHERDGLSEGICELGLDARHEMMLPARHAISTAGPWVSHPWFRQILPTVTLQRASAFIGSNRASDVWKRFVLPESLARTSDSEGGKPKSITPATCQSRQDSSVRACSDGCDSHPGKQRAEIGLVLLTES
jgi:hypothetical protein